MTLPYFLRLACLSLACFFAVNFAAGLAARWLATRAIRRAESMRPRLAARMLLTLRLFPAGFALLCVIGLCVPSYLLLEPSGLEQRGLASDATESVGLACLIAAALGAGMVGITIGRTAHAALRSRQYLRGCAPSQWKNLNPLLDPPTGVPVLVIPQPGRVIALAGILRPRVIVSAEVASALNAAEFSAALGHELAHHTSRDNLKRLLILLAPGFFVDNLDRAWKRLSEWAADDLAVAGDPRRAVELAAALVSAARVPAGAALPVLATTLVADGTGLAARVDRLLQGPVAASEPPRKVMTPSLIAIAVGIGVTLPFAPVILAWVHGLLERLMD